MPIITDFQKVLNQVHTSKNLENYQIQESVLRSVVNNYPTHNSKAAVELKVKLLNSFYSTNVMAVQQMTDKIWKIKDIDARLKCGDQTLVYDIAPMLGRNFYSFATKYCALHQPNLFPIFDSIVGDTFKKLLLKNHFAPQYNYNSNSFSKAKNTYSLKSFEKNILHDYVKYCELYKYFMKTFNLAQVNVRDVDWYIWGGKKLKIQYDLLKFL